MEVGATLQIKYASDEEWVNVTIQDNDTGTIKTFVVDDNITNAPVVTIKNNSTGDTNGICFINDHIIFDIAQMVMVPWRHVDEELLVVYSDTSELEKMVTDFVSNIFVDLLQKYRHEYELLPFKTRREWDIQILYIKEVIENKIVDFFKVAIEETPNTVVTLGKEEIEQILEECIDI